MKRKCLAVGIILLFIGVAIAPSINARNGTILPKAISNPEKEVSLIVLEYKPDGTVGKNVITMTQEEYQELRAELNGVKDSDEKLSLYKKYGLILQNTTLDMLREGMEEKAQKIGMTQQKLTQLILKNYKINRNKWIYFNVMCLVSVDGNCLLLSLGLSLLTDIIYFQWGILLPCFDISDRLIGFDGIFTAKGIILPDVYLTDFWLGKIVGFVGFLTVSGGGYNLEWVNMLGYSVYIRAGGLY